MSKSPYPNFNHNGKRVAAWNGVGLPLATGDRVHLTYTVNGRGWGSYSITSIPLSREIRADNRVTTPDTAGTVVGRYSDLVYWIKREGEEK